MDLNRRNFVRSAVAAGLTRGLPIGGGRGLESGTCIASHHAGSRNDIAARSCGFADNRVALPLPTPAQLEWQRDELAMFIHFGINTFTDREWGDGREDPALFAPSALDTRQWARTARAAGFRAMILTAKHHDGFCLWPSRTTTHTIAASPFRGGQADLVREFVDSCRAEGLRPGLYLSPWDRNHPAYGDSPRYNDVYCDQLTELLTRYGPLAEVWFDGANGEGPNRKHQVYDWPRIHALVRELQPGAVMFSNAGPDVRWCGNETGEAGDPCWSMVDPDVTPDAGTFSDAIREHLLHGSPTGDVWRPAEADTSIRPGWFHHPAEDASVRSAEQLDALFFSSVGRNVKLLLNVPPTRAGRLHETDVANLLGFRGRLDRLFDEDLADAGSASWRRTGSGTAELSLSFERPVTASVARIEEDIARGQRVAGWTLLASDGLAWQALATGTTIGYTRLCRFPRAAIRSVRLLIDDSIEPPERVRLRLFA